MSRTAVPKIKVQDEGVPLGSFDTLNFVGAGVTGIDAGGNVAQETIPGGGSFTRLTATGSINSVNTVFTFVSQPSFIVSDGVWYEVNVGWTWNAGTLTATLSVAPNDNIFGIQ